MFDGKTTQLKSHLEQCQIECLDWQVPIEKLIKVSSTDLSVIKLIKCFLFMNCHSIGKRIFYWQNV